MTLLPNMTRPSGDPKILQSGHSSRTGPDKLAHALGWFSLGLGLVELVAPHRLTRTLGMDGRETLVQAFGIREIVSGVMTLSTETQLGLWSRLAGDGIDLLALAAVCKAENPKRDNAAMALLLVGGIAALDMIGAQSVASRHGRKGRRRVYGHRSGYPLGLDRARGAARNLRRRPPSPARSFARPSAGGNITQ